VRGLRAVTDFEAEFSLVLGNEQLDSGYQNRVRDAVAEPHLSQFQHRAPGAEFGGRVIPGSVPRAVESKIKERFGI
jgi:hypothetical protein